MSTSVWPETFTPGIYPNMPDEEYFQPRRDVASSTALRTLIRQTPMHYLHAVGELGKERDETETAGQRFGKAHHCNILEPNEFDKRFYIVPPDAPRRPSIVQRNAKKPSEETIAAIGWWDEFNERIKGRTVLTADEWDRAQRMGDAVRTHPEAGGMLEHSGYNEVTLLYVDPATGVQCKARVDRWIPSLRTAFDLKSTDDASAESFARKVATYTYHLQQAHYTEAFRVLAGMFPGGWSMTGFEDQIEPLAPLAHYVNVVQEKTAPFAVACRYIGPVGEERGQELRLAALHRLKRCLDANEFPGYRGITEVVLPAHAMYPLEGERDE